MVEWAQLEALRFAIEMKQMYDITEEVVTPMPMLSNDPAKRLEATEQLANWVRADLISDQHPFHQACYDLGLSHALLFTLMEEKGAIDCLGPEKPRAAAGLIRHILKAVLSKAEGSQGRAFQTESFLQFMVFLEPYLGLDIELEDEVSVSAAIDAIGDEELLTSFPGLLVKGVDSIIPVVLHTTLPPFPARVDWEWLKGGVKALFESGDHCPAVIFSQDGMVGSGRLEEPFRCLSSISDPEVEVYVLDESSARNIAIKMTWDEVKEFHIKRSQGY